VLHGPSASRSRSGSGAGRSPLVEALLRDEDDQAGIGAANLAECADVLVRVKRVPEDEVERTLGLVLESLPVLPVDAAIALLAGRIRARRYKSPERAISLSDCLALATAVVRGERLASSDPALLRTAAEEGCAVVSLPDQRGVVPQ